MVKGTAGTDLKFPWEHACEIWALTFNRIGAMSYWAFNAKKFSGSRDIDLLYLILILHLYETTHCLKVSEIKITTHNRHNSLWHS